MKPGRDASAGQIAPVQALAAKNIRKYYGDDAVPAFAKEAEAKLAELAAKAKAPA
jgi:hypothetical protein